MRFCAHDGHIPSVRACALAYRLRAHAKFPITLDWRVIALARKRRAIRSARFTFLTDGLLGSDIRWWCRQAWETIFNVQRKQGKDVLLYIIYSIPVFLKKTGETALLCTLYINLLTPNDDYSGRTAPLTSKCCIL